MGEKCPNMMPESMNLSTYNNVSTPGLRYSTKRETISRYCMMPLSSPVMSPEKGPSSAWTRSPKIVAGSAIPPKDMAANSATVIAPFAPMEKIHFFSRSNKTSAIRKQAKANPTASSPRLCFLVMVRGTSCIFCCPPPLTVTRSVYSPSRTVK